MSERFNVNNNLDVADGPGETRSNRALLTELRAHIASEFAARPQDVRTHIASEPHFRRPDEQTMGLAVSDVDTLIGAMEKMLPEQADPEREEAIRSQITQDVFDAIFECLRVMEPATAILNADRFAGPVNVRQVAVELPKIPWSTQEGHSRQAVLTHRTNALNRVTAEYLIDKSMTTIVDGIIKMCIDIQTPPMVLRKILLNLERHIKSAPNGKHDVSLALEAIAERVETKKEEKATYRDVEFIFNSLFQAAGMEDEDFSDAYLEGALDHLILAMEEASSKVMRITQYAFKSFKNTILKKNEGKGKEKERIKLATKMMNLMEVLVGELRTNDAVGIKREFFNCFEQLGVSPPVIPPVPHSTK